MSQRVLPSYQETDSETAVVSNESHDHHNHEILVTVLMPCLNEARTVGQCIDQAHAGCQAALAARSIKTETPWSNNYEILIADNGSEDGSSEIAIEHGARVIHVAERGYGAALRDGFAAARGKYVVMGDADCSYDFGEVPRFLDKLEEGYDLVVGNRFAGGIQPGAMRWHHRYIGNPLLSWLGNLLYRTPCTDWHCGLRSFDRKKIEDLELRCVGMELASEMLVQASIAAFCVGEIPVTLKPDGRCRQPHLRSFQDGCRHLALLLSRLFRANARTN